MTASAVSQRVVACLDARGRGVLTEQPTPDLTPGCVRLRVTATMVSPGTQLNGVAAMRQGEKAGPDPAQPLGYQAAGVVVEVGAGVTRLSPGQRVACMGPGALHTDVAVVPQNLCAVIPDNVTDDEASGVNLVLTVLCIFMFFTLLIHVYHWVYLILFATFIATYGALIPISFVVLQEVW